MNKNFAIAFGIGGLCIAIAVGAVLYMQRGAHMELPGKILKVRTAPLDENSSAVVLDFRVTNPSDVLFVVRTVTVLLEDNAGSQYAGQTASDVDAKRLMEGIPLLGQKFNDTLIIKQRIEPHTSVDRMVAARFEAPEAKLEARKRFLIQVEEIDGKVFEVREK
jgi:hypothetical protein